MKSLKEALLNRPKNISGALLDVHEESIMKFLKQNYNGFDFDEERVTIKHTDNGTIVDYKGSLVFDGDGPLTNGDFRFGEVEDFDCSMCPDLVNLEGSPEIVKYAFNCGSCKNLKSLEGAPKKVGVEFVCEFCKNLKSLEGAPQPINNRTGYNLSCSGCKNLKNLKGCPEILKSLMASEWGLETLEGGPKRVFDMMNLRSCKSLTTLKGCPKKFTFLILTGCINLHSLEYVDLKDIPSGMKNIQISKNNMTITDTGTVPEERIHYM